MIAFSGASEDAVAILSKLSSETSTGFIEIENSIITECVEILDGHTTNKIYPWKIYNCKLQRRLRKVTRGAGEHRHYARILLNSKDLVWRREGRPNSAVINGGWVGLSFRTIPCVPKYSKVSSTASFNFRTQFKIY